MEEQDRKPGAELGVGAGSVMCGCWGGVIGSRGRLQRMSNAVGRVAEERMKLAGRVSVERTEPIHVQSLELRTRGRLSQPTTCVSSCPPHGAACIRTSTSQSISTTTRKQIS